MILIALILVPFVCGLLAWGLRPWDPRWPRWVSLVGLAITLALALIVWGQSLDRAPTETRPWLVEFNRPWIPQFGIQFHLAIDGLSLLLILLTAFLGIVAVAASWTEIRQRIGLFHFNLMWVLSGLIGLFLSLDLFLFSFFWEMMLVPMYFLIALWGHENRVYAAIKFFLFTQLSGLLMFLAIIGLYILHGNETGIYTFEYAELLGTPMGSGTAMLLMLGFFAAFAVKLPAVPVHTWLPDAHTEAPTAGSVILAGLLLKTGAYGLLRFVVPLFPGAAAQFAPVAMALAVVGILYGALLAFAQNDFKRLVAYTSVSHMGFVLLGVFAWDELALQGVMLQILAHGLSTGALFVLAGIIQERIHTREMSHMGGLWTETPRMGGVAMFFAMASLGLPGLANFVGEFLVLVGTYRVSVAATVFASLGLILSTIYSLWFVQLIFHGRPRTEWHMADLNAREATVFGLMMAAVVWLGVYPHPVLTTFQPSLGTLQQNAAGRVDAVATLQGGDR
jgi:NADH-quinone oxidoreductase subunit M